MSTDQSNLIDEFGSYKYDKDKIEKGKEEVVKQSDHGMDAMRYYVMGKWKFLKLLLPETERGDN